MKPEDVALTTDHFHIDECGMVCWGEDEASMKGGMVMDASGGFDEEDVLDSAVDTAEIFKALETAEETNKINVYDLQDADVAVPNLQYEVVDVAAPTSEKSKKSKAKNKAEATKPTSNEPATKKKSPPTAAAPSSKQKKPKTAAAHPEASTALLPAAPGRKRKPPSHLTSFTKI